MTHDPYALIPLGPNGVAPPPLDAAHDTLVAIARERAQAGLRDLEQDAVKAERHARIAAGFAVSAFNVAHPRLAIRGDASLTERQQAAFTKFVRRHMRPLAPAQLSRAAVAYMQELAAQEPVETGIPIAGRAGVFVILEPLEPSAP